MSTQSEKVSCIVRMTAVEGKRDQLLGVFETFLLDVMHEEGTEHYSYHFDQADPDVMWIVETYADKAALDAHCATEAYATMLAGCDGLVAKFPDLNAATPMSGKGLG